MLRRLKRQHLFALILSFSIPILSVYLLYCDVADNDLTSSHATYENDDVDDSVMVPDCQNQIDSLRLVASTGLFLLPLLEPGVIEQRPAFSFLPPLFEQTIVVLRC